MGLSDSLAPSTHSIVSTSREVSSAYTLHPEISSQPTRPIQAKRSDARANRTEAIHGEHQKMAKCKRGAREGFT